MYRYNQDKTECFFIYDVMSQKRKHVSGENRVSVDFFNLAFQTAQLRQLFLKSVFILLILVRYIYSKG